VIEEKSQQIIYGDNYLAFTLKNLFTRICVLHRDHRPTKQFIQNCLQHKITNSNNIIMIQLLATKYPRHIAYILFLIFCFSLEPAFARDILRVLGSTERFNQTGKSFSPEEEHSICEQCQSCIFNRSNKNAKAEKPVIKSMSEFARQPDIGGPGQPEMSSFKSAGTDNMVNLFTGDFSYNINLLDVGGYPVNIFYDGGISSEQEASWVVWVGISIREL